MFDELNTVIEKRVKEVLQFHLNGTQEEFEAAATAVVSELTAMGDSLSDIVFESGGMTSLTEPGGREALVTQMTDVLNKN